MAKRAGGGKAKQSADGIHLILRNRRLRHDYEVLRSMEAGLVLAGSEVKSLRTGEVQWADAHARFDRRGELWLHGLHIGEYQHAGYAQHEPRAPRKLLLKRRELDALIGQMQTKGLSLVPAQLYFRDGWGKCELALVRGRKHADKRGALRERERERDVQREIARRLR